MFVLTHVIEKDQLFSKVEVFPDNDIEDMMELDCFNDEQKRRIERWYEKGEKPEVFLLNDQEKPIMRLSGDDY